MSVSSVHASERRSAGAAICAMLYIAVFVVAHGGARTPLDPTPWNGAPVLLILLAATLGTAATLPVVLSVFVGEALARGTGPSAAVYMIGCVGVSATYLAAGLIGERSRRIAAIDPTLADLTRFFALAGVAALLASAIWVAVHAGVPFNAEAPGGLLTRTVIGDLGGIVTLAPLAFMIAGRHVLDWSAGERSVRQISKDFGGFLGMLLPLLAVVFWLRPFDEFRTSYLLFLPMIGIALRYGLSGAAVVVPLVQVGLLVSLHLANTRAASAYEYQLLMLTLAAGALCLGMLSTERARAMRTLARRDAELREREHQTNQALRAAAASEMASGLAHELNQPLSAIGTYSRACHEMMADPVHHRAQLSATLDKVARESARAGEIVRRMRDFFRSGALKLEAVPLADLVSQVREQIDDRCKRCGVTLSTELPAGLPLLGVDPVQMRIVLANLLNNAIDAVRDAPMPRWILLNACIDGTVAVRIDVQDSGLGVPIEVRDQLFEPLATSKPDGMGLGLAIARGIVMGHGGSLWLDAERSNTTFSLQVPCSA